MKKMTSRFLALLMAAVMAVSMLPVNAYAEGEEPETVTAFFGEGREEVVLKAGIPLSGQEGIPVYEGREVEKWVNEDLEAGEAVELTEETLIEPSMENMVFMPRFKKEETPEIPETVKAVTDLLDKLDADQITKDTVDEMISVWEQASAMIAKLQESSEENARMVDEYMTENQERLDKAAGAIRSLKEEPDDKPVVTLQDQINASDGEYSVDGNEIVERLMIPENRTVTLVLAKDALVKGITNNGSLTIEGTGKVTAAEGAAAVISNSGNLVIEGGEFDAGEMPIIQNSDEGTVKVLGGTFNQLIPDGFFDDEHFQKLEAGKYVVTDKAVVRFEIKAAEGQTISNVVLPDGGSFQEEAGCYTYSQTLQINSNFTAPKPCFELNGEKMVLTQWKDGENKTVEAGKDDKLPPKKVEYTLTASEWKPDINGDGIPDEDQTLRSVIYTDGVNGAAFSNQRTQYAVGGDPMPQFLDGKGQPATPVRAGHVFAGWKLEGGTEVLTNLPEVVPDESEAPLVYIAQWLTDKNEDGIPDQEQVVVTYRMFSDQDSPQDKNLYIRKNEPFPAYGADPVRAGYLFGGWDADLPETVGEKNHTLTAQWLADKNEDKIPDRDQASVTYTDGLQGQIFQDQAHLLLKGAATPAFTGKAERPGYVFGGWNPEIKGTVAEDTVYTAVWLEDRNGDGIADQDQATVTYTDGLGGQIFQDQSYLARKGLETPAFTGKTERTDYVFGGWSPALAETVTGDAVYTAVWKEDLNRDGIADENQSRFTVKYTDGVKNRIIFEDLIWTVIGDNQPTPPYQDEDGEYKDPVREGYLFMGWKPEVAQTVTADAVYTATWKADKNQNGIPDENETEYRTVRAVWKSDTVKTRPTSVTVQLLKNGTAYGDPVKLTAENKWTYKWTTLENGQKYEVVEMVVPKGYRVSYSSTKYTFTITNKRSVTPYKTTGKPLQTGQLNWPIPVLAVCGVAAISGGLALILRKRRSGHEK